MLWRKREKRGRYYGQVYVLSNRTMPGLVKIGFTRRTTRLRADELSGATGVPVPFDIEFSRKVAFPDKVEEIVHHRLRSDRVNKNREFFRVSPDLAKKEVIRAASKYGNKQGLFRFRNLAILGLLLGALTYYDPTLPERFANIAIDAVNSLF